MGDRGVSERMQAIYHAASVAFHLEDILNMDEPKEEHNKALQKLYALVKPKLMRRPWPPPDYEASPTRKVWPNPHEKGILRFYQQWWSNIYAAARASARPSAAAEGQAMGGCMSPLPFSGRWRRLDALSVVPLLIGRLDWEADCYGPLLLQLVRQRLCPVKWKNLDRGARLGKWGLVDVLCAFVLPGPGVVASRSMLLQLVRQMLFPVQWKKLKPPSRLVVWRVVDVLCAFVPPAAQHFRVSPETLASPLTPAVGMYVGLGVVARLTTPRLKGKLVRITATVEAWDTRAVASSLQHEHAFSVSPPVGFTDLADEVKNGAFYINAMFSVVVRMGNTSSACERWGHELKLLWDPQRTQTTTGLIHRLHGRLCGLRGNGTDEHLLDVIASSMSRCGEATSWRNAPRAGNGRAMATWRAQQFQGRDQSGARTLYTEEGLQEPPAASDGQRLAFTRAMNLGVGKLSKGVGKLSKASDLDRDDFDILQKIHARNPGWRHPAMGKASVDKGSVMPWYANTRKQWDGDLAKWPTITPSEALGTTTTGRASRAMDVLARRDKARPKRPSEPSAQAALHGASSSSDSSSSSTSSSSSCAPPAKAKASGSGSGVGGPKSGAAASGDSSGPTVSEGAAELTGPGDGAPVPWAHNGGKSRIHAFFGCVERGTAYSMCHRRIEITSSFRTGLALARAMADAETSANAKWCKDCQGFFRCESLGTGDGQVEADVVDAT